MCKRDNESYFCFNKEKVKYTQCTECTNSGSSPFVYPRVRAYYCAVFPLFFKVTINWWTLPWTMNISSLDMHYTLCHVFNLMQSNIELYSPRPFGRLEKNPWIPKFGFTLNIDEVDAWGHLKRKEEQEAMFLRLASPVFWCFINLFLTALYTSYHLVC